MDFALKGLETRTLSESGVAMVVRDLEGAPVLDKNGKEVRITLLGPDSTVYRRMVRERVRKRLAVASAGKETTPDEDEADGLDVLVALVVGWEGVNTPKGEAIPCTPEAVRALFTNYPAVREQADAFATNRLNFIKG